MRATLLLPMLLALTGCAWMSETARDVADFVSSAGDSIGESWENAKPVAYDVPGTEAQRLSPEVVGALAGASDTGAFDPIGAESGTSNNVRLYRIEQALAVAVTDYDRAWLKLEEAELLASMDRCDAALLRYENLIASPSAPAAQKLQARAAKERIDRGVCWTRETWDGYRYRPAPSFPPQKGRIRPDGDVEMLLYVSPHGSVREVVVTRADLKVLEGYALNAAHRWRFGPFEVDGVRIPFVLKQTLQFRYPQIFVRD